MSLKFVILLVFVAVCSTVCWKDPNSIRKDGNDSKIEQKLVAYYIRIADEQFVPRLDAETANKYAEMVRCYNGAFTKLKRECDSKGDCDITQDPLYRLCNENRELILDSYLGNIGKLTGASILVPIDYYKIFTLVVKRDHIDTNPLEENLRNYPGMWIYQGEMIRYNDYCKEMIYLVDEEFPQWGYDKQNVIDFFESKTKLPFGQALELCRLRLEVSV